MPKVINEISYSYIICPKCLYEHQPLISKEEFCMTCTNCNTDFRVVEETVIRYTTSMIK